MKKDEYTGKERRGAMDNDLADSNEQEMEKIGFRRASPPEGDRFRKRTSGRRTSGERTPSPSTELVKNEIKSERALQTHTEEMRAIKDGDTSVPCAPTHNEKTHMRELAGQEAEKKEKGGHPMRLLALLMAGILLLALAVLGGAWLYGDRWSEDALEDGAAEETPTRSEEGQKIVFVRQDMGESGVLSAPELYAACADTVVSILTDRAGHSGVGSGFLMTEDGYVGTAYHVVEGADRQVVMLSDGTRYDATLVAGNALTDLALLKIEGQGFPSVTFGSSEELLIGERVFAIGTPASVDYAGSMSSGEVSYLRRTVRINEEMTGALQKKMTLIQTTAPVNPGNSGCPLFDEYGHLVGVITMKLGNSFAGIGFAIPSDGALSVLRAMMEGEPLSDTLLSSIAVSAPRLGVLGEADNMNGIYGILVVGFADGSASAQVLKAGDLITRIDETPICSASDIDIALREKNPGDTVHVTVLRGAQSLTFEVVLGK